MPSENAKTKRPTGRREIRSIPAIASAALGSVLQIALVVLHMGFLVTSFFILVACVLLILGILNIPKIKSLPFTNRIVISFAAILAVATLSSKTLLAEWNLKHDSAEQDIPVTSATTNGNNSQIYQNSGSGSISVNISNGLTKEQMLDLLQAAQDRHDLVDELPTEFPAGYALFGGIGNGNTVWLPRFKAAKLEGDWDSTTLSIISESPLGVKLHISNMTFTYPAAGIKSQSLDEVDLIFFGIQEGVTVPSRFMGVRFTDGTDGPVFWLKVLDSKKGIFVIGFKKVID